MLVRLGSERGIDVAQVLVGDRVAGVGAYGHLQLPARVLVAALARVEHRQVVVRLGQFRELLAQCREHVDGLLSAVLLREDDALQEARARIARVLAEVGVQARQGCGDVALLMQLDGLGVAVGFGRGAAAEPRKHQGDGREAGETASSCYTFLGIRS